MAGDVHGLCGGLRALRGNRTWQQDFSIDVPDIGVAAEGHGHVEFLVQDLQRLGHPGFAHGTEAIHHGAADHRAARAQCPGLEHVLAAADAAVHPYLGLATDRRDDGRQGLDARWRPIELASAMVADDDGVGADLDRELGVFDIHDALEDQLAAPALLDPGHVFPRKARIELLVGPCGQRSHVADPLDMTDQIAEGMAPCAHHAQPPAWLEGDVDRVAQRRDHRGAQLVLQVLVALADHLQVQCQHQRAATRGLAAVDHARHGLAVTHHVELEPERRAGVFGDVLDRADAHRRQGERNAELLGRPRGEDLAVGVLHAGQAHRRNRHRHFYGAADHLGCRRAVLHVDGHALAQLDFLEVLGVGAVGALGPRAGIGIVVEHAGHALLRQYAQVFDGGDDGHGCLLESGVMLAAAGRAPFETRPAGVEI